MKLLITLSLSLVLSGCIWQSVNFHDIEKAKEICQKNNSTIAHINAHAMGEEFVHCANRQSYNLDRQ